MLITEAGHSIQVRHDFSEALIMYLRALDYSYTHDIREHRLDVRIKCAEICLKLQKYSEAYTHCEECNKLDPKNHMVRRSIYNKKIRVGIRV